MKKKLWNILALFILLIIIFIPANINPVSLAHENAHKVVAESFGKICVIKFSPFSGIVKFNGNEEYNFDTLIHTYIDIRTFPDGSVRLVKYVRPFRVNGALGITVCSSMTTFTPSEGQSTAMAGILSEFLIFLALAFILPVSIISAVYFLYTSIWLVCSITGLLYIKDIQMAVSYGLSPLVIFVLVIFYVLLSVFLFVRYINCYVFPQKRSKIKKDEKVPKTKVKKRKLKKKLPKTKVKGKK